jgi:AAA15 family ATPase/GTPase
MHIKSLTIQNFKAFKNVTIHFNRDLNVLTGVNNSGKTTVLEALSLWQECFSKLISEAKRAEKTYKRGDYILGPSYNKYFPFNEINSVRSPNFEDIFHNRDTKNEIIISLTIEDEEGYKQTIPFHIKSSGSNYVISLHGYSSFNHRAFNDFFSELPNPVSLVYGTPVAQIDQEEQFTTDPSIKDKLLLRKSISVFRNRLYRILNGLDAGLTNFFLSDLNYILFNSEKKIEFRSVTNIQRDSKVIILFKIGNKDIEKDIALLGSGTLQIIEILLNLYYPIEGKKDLTLVLLDEPDSHIHRDIQKRLIQTFNNFGKDIQIFITTHNESLIRDAAPNQVFHLDGKSTGIVESIHFDNTDNHLGLHFKGIMPSRLTPVIRSIGNTNGLDFINALEADKLIFVEGEDDARAFRILLNQQINNRKKYMFWVLGGVSEIFENILSYQTVFSAIKNQKSLWEKSVLCFDKDELSNEHKDVLLQKFKQRLGIEAYSSNAYTFEATLMTDLTKTAKLICRLIEKANGNQVDTSVLFDELNDHYSRYKTALEAKLSDKYFEDTYYRYKNSKNEKTKLVFEEKECLFKPKGEAQLMTYIRSYFSSSIASGEYYKLMDKKDVENVILPVVEPYGINFSIETDFIELIKLVDKSTWIDEWNFLNKI